MLKEEELTRKIIGLAMKIHRELGPGFKEKVYSESLINLLKDEGLIVELEVPFTIIYNGRKVGSFRADIVVNKKVIIELKAIIGKIPRIFYTQLLSYLKASGLSVGLILNFGNYSLEIKRFVN